MKRKQDNQFIYSTSQNYMNIEKLLGKFGHGLKVNKISREFEFISKFEKSKKKSIDDTDITGSIEN